MKIFNSKNKISLTAIGVFFILVVVVGWINLPDSKDQSRAVNNTQEDPKLLNESERLSPRQQAINDYLSGKTESRKVLYGDMTFSLVVYKDSEGVWDKERKYEIHNHADFPYDRPGMILFNGQEIYWESDEIFFKIYPETVELVDLDNDGSNEIYVIDLVGEKLTGCSVTAYKWINNNFELITPSRKVEGTYPRDETKSYEGVMTTLNECEPSFSPNGLFDLDGDKVLEITTHEYSPNNAIRAYKWDGRKYKGWRELITGPEIGLGEYKGSAQDFLKDSKIISNQ